MKKALVIALVLLVALSSIALAGKNTSAKVAVHVKLHSAKQACAGLPAIEGCADIVTTYPGFSFDAFPVFFDLVEFLGLEYAMCWPDWQYSAAFTSCSMLKIGDISRPGDGISQTWTACTEAPIVVPGWAWLYADGPGLVCVCLHPVTAKISVLDCSDGVDQPVSVYSAGVFGESGEDPCQPTATEQTTWGAIKSIFR